MERPVRSGSPRRRAAQSEAGERPFAASSPMLAAGAMLGELKNSPARAPSCKHLSQKCAWSASVNMLAEPARRCRLVQGKNVEVVIDYQGIAVRMTDERLAHILEHPEMVDLQSAIAETLKRPALVIQSVSDAAARLYYRLYPGTRVGDKFLCVVVKVGDVDAFVLTAYMTDKPKKGTVLWSAKT